MEKEEIKRYITSREKFDVPEIQNELSLSYAQLKTVLEELVQSHEIEFVSGVTYQVVKKGNAAFEAGTHFYQPKNQEEAVYIKALWECIEYDSVSCSLLQRKLAVGYIMAGKAIQWMEDNKFVSEFSGTASRKLLITREQFIEIFGDPDKVNAPEEEEEDPLSEMRRRWRERLSQASDDDDKDDDKDGDADDIGKLLQELNELEGGSGSDDDGDPDADDYDDDWPSDIRQILLGGLMFALEDQNSEGMYVLELDEERSLEFRFVKEDDTFKISDGGKTLAQTPRTKRRVNNVLKGFASVVLEGEEICVRYEHSFDSFRALLMLLTAVEAVKRIK